MAVDAMKVFMSLRPVRKKVEGKGMRYLNQVVNAGT